MFINSTDGKAAQMFTIIHELVHLWLGESAGFENNKLLPANDPIEIFCDKVAAELLVPTKLFIEVWNKNKNFKTLSKHFKVSSIVIARRALDLRLISKKDFFIYYESYLNDLRNKKNKISSGGDFFATQKRRLNLRFANYVNTAVKENKLLFRDAYKITGLKGDTYQKFMTKHLY
jgi:Zn-dependent peptidase ImmA (M78 family)